MPISFENISSISLFCFNQNIVAVVCFFSFSSAIISIKTKNTYKLIVLCNVRDPWLNFMVDISVFISVFISLLGQPTRFVQDCMQAMVKPGKAIAFSRLTELGIGNVVKEHTFFIYLFFNFHLFSIYSIVELRIIKVRYLLF